MNKYKLIEISNKFVEKNKLSSALLELFKNYNPKDIHYKIKGDRIVVCLNVLNFSKFKKDTKKVINAFKDKGVSDVLNRIVKDIDKIKSYGIKGKKRLFGGYNQERKVRNRKLKEKHRRANKIKTPTRKRIINSVSDEYIDNESNNTRKGFN